MRMRQPILKYILSDEYNWINVKFPYIASEVAIAVQSLVSSITNAYKNNENILEAADLVMKSITRRISNNSWYSSMKTIVWDAIEDDTMLILKKIKRQEDNINASYQYRSRKEWEYSHIGGPSSPSTPYAGT